MLEFFNTLFGQIIVQSIGFVAMALGIASFQRKKRNSIIAFQMSASSLWMLQFILLGGYTGAIQNGIAIVRGAFFAQKDRLRWVSSRITPAIFITAFIIAGIFTFGAEGPITLLPVAAMIIQTVALFCNNENRIRYLSLMVSPLWLIYDFRTGTVAGVICESFTICSIIISLIRFRTKRNTKAEDLSKDAVKDSPEQ